MAKRPLALVISALLFLYFPLELAWKIYFREFPWTAGDLFFSGALPIMLLIGLIRVTRVGWYTLVAVVALLGVRDLYEYYAMRGASISTLLTHLGIYAISLSYFINPRVRTLYFDPKARWWKTKPRFETHLPIVMKVGEEWRYPILTNISEGGCFVETTHFSALNDKLEVAIPLPIPLNVSVIQAAGEVRWVSKNPLRSGMGIQFSDMPEEQANAVRDFVHLQL